jgi:tetratricopeptide (TPR) repeat protein
MRMPRCSCLACGFVLAVLVATVPSVFAQVGRPEVLYVRSWAIVIGIDEYQVAPKLTGAVTDAKAMAAAFRKLGFEDVVEIYNQDARSRNLKSILTADLPRKVGRQDRVVIYFAGHAGITKDMLGKDLGYLVPWDSPPTNVTKAVTMDDLKEFARRVSSKHILFLLDASVAGWEVTPPQQLSLEGRLAPEEETDKRAVQLVTAASKGEVPARKNGQGIFVQALLSGLEGAGDTDKNGWLMVSELGAYVKQQVEQATGGAQHPQVVRMDGDGDGILVEGRKAAFRTRPEPTTEAERVAAAKEEYEKAFSLLQEQKSVQEAMERLDKAVRYNPTYGDAYVLQSFVYLDIAPNLDKALAAGQLAVKHAPGNPDSHYTLGLVYQRKGQFADAEQAFKQALAVNPQYTDVYLSLGDLYAQDLKDRKKSLEAYQRYVETGGTENRVREYLRESGSAPPEGGPRP